ncbi:MAG: AAA family ATPase [Thermoguttaceae bacterium]|jgi:type II secretory pathway predicted ATPase ExeA
MYETYFKFSERPFASVPRTDHYFPAATIEAARSTLIRSIDRAEGPAIVIGCPGTGKTLLCRLLAEHFQEAFRVVLLGTGRLATRRALLQAILYELHQPYRGLDEGELRLALGDQATLGEDGVGAVVLLADEAHNLPLRLLDEVRMLTDLVRQDQPAVRLVLAGGRGLEERLANPRLESFSQRLAVRCYLEAFDRAETQRYIHARITAAGGRAAQIFPPETCQSVYKATDGVPRLINQVCDHALVLACAAGLGRIEPAHLEEAWADLQQLPTPSSDPARDTAPAVIEFGGLEDEPAADETPGQPDADSTRHLLRISPAGDESEPPEAGDLEPAAQIGRIQEILAEAKGEFEPAADPPTRFTGAPGCPAGPEVELSLGESDHPFRETFAQEEVVADRYALATARHPLPRSSGAAVPAAGVGGTPAPQVEPAPALSHTAEELSHAAEEQVAFPQADPEHAPPDDRDTSAVEEGLPDTPWPTCTIAAVKRQRFGGLFAHLQRCQG